MRRLGEQDITNYITLINNTYRAMYFILTDFDAHEALAAMCWDEMVRIREDRSRRWGLSFWQRNLAFQLVVCSTVMVSDIMQEGFYVDLSGDLYPFSVRASLDKMIKENFGIFDKATLDLYRRARKIFENSDISHFISTEREIKELIDFIERKK
ncbi:MAG: hypothetical protein GF349_01405 [Candidatus Magasanikbacteria bacterium]|nr:hypothetical protein [Candidatus Magasanikbacteria bacterium]